MPSSVFGGVLKDFEHSQYIKLENGYSADVYSLEVIIAIALQVDTYQALLFRRWLMENIGNCKESKATPEKQGRTMIIVMNGKMPRCQEASAKLHLIIL